MKQSEQVPKQLQPSYDEITAITDAFCHEHLNAEYARLSRQLAAALSRKRPSPLLGGKVTTWACGIVYALGSVNFLSDRSSEPFMRMEDLCALMSVSKSTGANKAAEIRKLFGMYQFDPNWTLPNDICARSLDGIRKRFDFVSTDGQIVGDAKYYTLVGGERLPPAKFAIIAEHVWLLEKTNAPAQFLVFGNDREVPLRWLVRYGALAGSVQFFFVSDEGHLEVLQ
jgi:hypothetical protein